MLRSHRLRLFVGAAAVVALVAFAVHAAAQMPPPGRYVSWAPPAEATASPGAGPAIPVASAPPAAGPGPLEGLTLPLSGLLHQLNVNTAQTASGQYSILQALESALATRIQQFLGWVTGGR